MDENALLVEQRSVMSGEIDKLQQRLKQCEHERSQLNSRIAQVLFTYDMASSII